MKKSNRIYISIFYERQAWHILLKYLTLILKQDKIVFKDLTFIVHFRERDERYIGLSIFGLRKSLQQALEILQAKLFQFFSNNPSLTHGNKSVSEVRLFDPVPLDTLHYNFHHFPFLKNGKLERRQNISLSIIVTHVILENLVDAPITNQTLILSLYLQILLLRAFFDKLEACLDFLTSKMNLPLLETSEINVPENIRAAVPEILSDVFKENIWHLSENTWMHNWINECKRSETNDTIHTINNKQKLISAISKATSRQLGINLGYGRAWHTIIVKDCQIPIVLLSSNPHSCGS